MAKHSSQILEMARKGAEHRYRELTAEIASLVEHFPHLGASQPSAPQSSTTHAEMPALRHQKRRKMSAAARKKISDAQKARWAKQKAKG